MIRLESIKLKVPNTPTHPKIIEVKIGDLINAEVCISRGDCSSFIKGRITKIDTDEKSITIDSSKECESCVEKYYFNQIGKLYVIEEDK
jgi:NADH dehydrogenase FAD-containing subunit